jgi:hypothetical protein
MVVLGLAACGGDGGQPAEEERLTTGELTSLCTQMCDHLAACDAGDAACMDNCLSWPEQHMIAPPFRAYAACIVAADCQMLQGSAIIDTEGECTVLAETGATQQAFMDDCRAASQACTTNDIESCAFGRFFDEATIAELRECIEPCQDADACMGAVVAE